MSRPRLELEGRRFGDLEAVSLLHTTPEVGAVWLCRCLRHTDGTRACGEVRFVPAKQLRSGSVTCCEGCARRKRTTQLQTSRNASLCTRAARSRATFTPSEYLAYNEILDARRRQHITITPEIERDATDCVLSERHEAEGSRG